MARAYPEPHQQLARVVEVQRNAVKLHAGTEPFAAQFLPRVRALAVGDWVIAEADAHAQVWVIDALPAWSSITRIDGGGVLHAVVNNVDTLLIVMGLDSDFNLNRAERYLLLAHAAQVEPVMVLSKSDLCADVDARIDALRERLGARLDVQIVNGLDAATCQGLQPYLGAGQTLALMGSSGAGKSTLTNALLQRAAQSTGAVHASGDSGRGMQGKHTTTARSLFTLPSGACLIDTPGLRTLRVEGDASTVASGFEDIAELAQHCKFADCQHGSEPGCAVREAVNTDRLKNYQKLLRDAQRDSMTALQRQAQRREWKVRGQAGKLNQQIRGKS
jgi:ribosome biogenesis GTPase / thiamine phosphate phosphatase